ncbi:hypothetical protein CPB85DRAFT_1437579 [Mucidula mucida]|nr:hypothetical protein CPB85DRAFT_1437579 [Mucidula mucida]
MHLCRPETLQSQIFWDSICHCFPLGDASLGFVDPGHVNQGLANIDWWKRAEFVYTLKRVTDLWKVDSLVDEAEADREFERQGFTPEEMESFTSTIFKHYIGNFFQVFGRPPWLPMNLPFQPETTLVLPAVYDRRVGDDKWLPRAAHFLTVE